MKLKILDIKKICISILKKHGLTNSEADIVLNEYLYGELTGKLSHGLAAFPKTIKKIKKCDPWLIDKEGPSFALINGKGNIGQLLGKYAIDLGIKKATETGIAMIGIYNMHSYLMPGYYANLASEKNMIGIIIDNSKSRVAPYSGIDPKIGTNPIGLSLPTITPFTLDMATSVRAMGEVRIAKHNNTKLPENMAMDINGNATTDPNKVNALYSFGGYKGFGLGLAIEILAGALVGAKMGKNIQDSTDRGYLFIIINPSSFGTLDKLKQDSEELFNDIKKSRTKTNNELHIPGEYTKTNINNDFITNIDEKTYNQILELAK